MLHKKILLIDDSEFILDATAALLMFADYDVITANNGEEGIQLAIKELPNLIICDVSMPKMNGYEVLKEIKTNAITASIPFIFLTAFAEKAKMREGMEKGANDYLTKPFTKEELLSAINAQWERVKRVETQLSEKINVIGKNLRYALPHEFYTVISQLIGSIVDIKDNINIFEKQDVVEVCDQMLGITARLKRISENFVLFTKLENYLNSPEAIKELCNSKTDEPFATIMDLTEIIASRHNRVADIEIVNSVFDISVAMSSDLLHKLVEELIDNALKFSKNGSKVIIDSTIENGSLSVTIMDSGIGMTQEQIGEISAFMQFQREENEQQGIGMGLAIAKRIVELHNGIFDIKSEKDKSTAITFTIPLVQNSTN